MVNFVDALSPETVEKAEGKAQDALLQMVEADQYSIPEEWFDVSRPIVYAVWLHLWNSANIRSDGSRVTSISVTEALRRATDGFLDDKKNNRIASAVSRLLVANGLLPPGHSRRKPIQLWREIDFFPYHKVDRVDVVVEKRIAQEADKPVRVYFDIEQIPAPDPNPKSVMEYIRKIKASYAKLQERYDKLSATCEEQEAEIGALRAKLEGSEWQEVVDFIKGD